MRARARDDRRPVLHRRRRRCAATSPRACRVRRSRCAYASSTPRPASRSRARPSTSGTRARAGKYSGAEANDTVGRTYLRGIQRTDAKGLALFKTVYPGWYQGRAVHIHVKVHVGRRRRAHRPALLPRQLHGRRLQARAVQGRAARATCATPTTRSTAAAAAARWWPCAAAGKATPGAISMGVRRS